jgi:hypothetical protein
MIDGKGKRDGSVVHDARAVISAVAAIRDAVVAPLVPFVIRLSKRLEGRTR